LLLLIPIIASCVGITSNGARGIATRRSLVQANKRTTGERINRGLDCIRVGDTAHKSASTGVPPRDMESVSGRDLRRSRQINLARAIPPGNAVKSKIMQH
jgi:hypothetical protein